MGNFTFDFKVSAPKKVDLSVSGLTEVLTAPPILALVTRVGQQIAAGAKSLIPADSKFWKEKGSSIDVTTYYAHGGRLYGRRLAAKVRVNSRYGPGLQARYGVLTKAAREVGAQVRYRK
jgi:hypothetical protein